MGCAIEDGFIWCNDSPAQRYRLLWAYNILYVVRRRVNKPRTETPTRHPVLRCFAHLATEALCIRS